MHFRKTTFRVFDFSFTCWSCGILFIIIQFLNICGSTLENKKPDALSDKKPRLHSPKLIIDSIDALWGSVDKDDNGHLTEEEISAHFQSIFEHETRNSDMEKVNSSAKTILKILDNNLDTVVTVYELRLALYGPDNYENTGTDNNHPPDFIKWMRWFIGKTPSKIPLHLVKLYQLFDEDINGKLTRKESRVVIKMVQTFLKVPKFLQMHENGMKSTFETMDIDDNKWLNLEEFSNLLFSKKLNILNDKNDLAELSKWIHRFLEGNSEYATASESTCKDFDKLDMNPDGIISKGELIEVLHKHRKDYYNEARINRRFTRSDRNGDRMISFNEYVFLEVLKNRKK